jgi:AcrR family transcriptional regulator
MVDRFKPEVRREQILAAAIELAEKEGFNNLSRDGIAAYAGVAKGQIHHMFETMDKLRCAVMKAAVHREILPVIAQGLANGDKVAHEAPVWLKQKALASLVEV